MNLKILLFILFSSINVYSQSSVYKVSQVFVQENSSRPNNSFVEIDAENELFVLNIEGWDKIYFKIKSVYFEPENGYSNLILQGTEEVFTVVMYFDGREKNMRIDFPDMTVYLTIYKN